jgi:hypothetical protein
MAGLTSTLDGGIDVPTLKISGQTYNNSGNALIDMSAAQHFLNTVEVDGAVTLNATIQVDGAANVDGGFTCDTDKFIVANTTGNTTIAGTLSVTGATTLTGALTANGGITCDTDKFTVADTTGNTAIGGTLTVTGAQTFTGATSHAGHVTLSDVNLILGTTTGTKVGTSVSQKLGFYNATPVVQPAAAAQAAVSGTADSTYSTNEQNLINDLVTLVNRLRSDLVTLGLIKGAA